MRRASFHCPTSWPSTAGPPRYIYLSRLGACLAADGLKVGQGIVWGDEMRLGLLDRVCKVWAPRGWRWPRPCKSAGRHLCDGGHRSADGAAVAGVSEEYERREDGPHLGGLGAGAGHRRLGLERGWEPHGEGDAGRGHTPVVQPPYAPELNPVERFFRELGRSKGGSIQTCRPSRRPWSRF